MGRNNQETTEIVTGASGARCSGLIGAMRALEGREVVIGSTGSLIAALDANGYHSEDFEKLFAEDWLPNEIVGCSITTRKHTDAK